MTKTIFRPTKLTKRPQTTPRCRTSVRSLRSVHGGLPEYDPRLSAREGRWYDLFLRRSSAAGRRRRPS